MKLWQVITLIVGALVFMVIGGVLTTILPIDVFKANDTEMGESKTDDSKGTEHADNPKYAPGEASAMLERVYGLRATSFTEEYLGQGIWEVEGLTEYRDAIFRVYEATGTVQPYNETARIVLLARKASGTKPKNIMGQ